jgi:hypothetical protein
MPCALLNSEKNAPTIIAATKVSNIFFTFFITRTSKLKDFTTFLPLLI